MPRARLTILLTAFCLITGLLGWEGARSAATDANQDDSYQYTLLFARVLQLIRQDYVDPSKVGYKDLTYAALRGMLSSLDPHSQFLDEESYQDALNIGLTVEGFVVVGATNIAQASRRSLMRVSLSAMAVARS